LDASDAVATNARASAVKQCVIGQCFIRGTSL
jgi:hypothetical protein